MIQRILQKNILKLWKKFPAIALMGPRQSGKTTLVKNLFPRLPYISFEDFDAKNAVENDPRGFLAGLKNGAILDEVQRVPHIFSYLQTAIDETGNPSQFVLTGSQNFLLHEKISQSLAGRVALFTLLPFSFDELKEIPFNAGRFEDYIFHGFYPRPHIHSIAPSEWYPSYIQTYVERDVRQIKNITDLNMFQKFLKLCAGRTGQLLNFSSLASDCGITHTTAKSWISLLEASFIIFLLKPYFKNFNKRVIKMPKIYFYDTGLACSLLGITAPEQIFAHYLRGGLFENFVIAEFMKYHFHRGIEPRLSFWRDKSGREIDCIIEQGPERVIPVEIKAGATMLPELTKHLDYFRALSKNKSMEAFVVYGGEKNWEQKKGNFIAWKNLLSVLGPVHRP